MLSILIVGLASIFFHALGLWGILPSYIVYSDVLGFFNQAIAPGFPYLEKMLEYPVLSGLFIQLMGYLSFGNQFAYYFLSALFLVLCAALSTFILYKLVPEKEHSKIWQFWILAPSMFIFLVYNWDMLALLFVVAAFYFMRQKAWIYAAILIALGFSSKFFPIIYLAPILIIAEPFRQKLKALSAFLVTSLIINLPFMVLNFSGWFYFFKFNSARNSNPDSIWTIFRFIFGEIGISNINLISFIMFAGAFSIVLWRYHKSDILKLCFAGTILFLLFNKVFSPQYTLWLLPFFVLAIKPNNIWFYILEFSNLAALFTILPWHLLGHDIVYFYLAIPFVLLRHAILLSLLRYSLDTRY